MLLAGRTAPSLACAWLRVHAVSLTTKMPSNRARTLARAIDHQRRQEQHAMDSSLLAAMASAGDESPGGDGTMNGDGLRAPLGTGAREPTPWFDRAIGGGGLHARPRIEPGETDPRACHDPATGDGWSRSSTEKSYGWLWALEVAIWCLDIMLDALQHIERRTRRERMVQSPV